MSITHAELLEITDAGIALSSIDTLDMTFRADSEIADIPWIWGGDWLNPPSDQIRHVQIPFNSLPKLPALTHSIARIDSLREICLTGCNKSVLDACLDAVEALFERLPQVTHASLQEVENWERLFVGSRKFWTHLDSFHLKAPSALPLSDESYSILKPTALLFSKVRQMPPALGIDKSRLRSILFDEMEVCDMVVSTLADAPIREMKFFQCTLAPSVPTLLATRFPECHVSIE